MIFHYLWGIQPNLWIHTAFYVSVWPTAFSLEQQGVRSLQYSTSAWLLGGIGFIHFFWGCQSIFIIDIFQIGKAELFPKGLLLHWRQVTFVFLWLMLHLLFWAINVNIAENASELPPEKFLVSLCIFSKNLFLLHSGFVENHHNVPSASTEFQTLVLPPQASKHLRLLPSLWERWGKKETSGEPLAPAEGLGCRRRCSQEGWGGTGLLSEDRWSTNARSKEAWDASKLLQWRLITSSLLQWRLIAWAAVGLNCRKEMGAVMTPNLALLRSREAGGSGILQVDFWESHFPFSLGLMAPSYITVLVWGLFCPTSS